MRSRTTLLLMLAAVVLVVCSVLAIRRWWPARITINKPFADVAEELVRLYPEFNRPIDSGARWTQSEIDEYLLLRKHPAYAHDDVAWDLNVVHRFSDDRKSLQVSIDNVAKLWRRSTTLRLERVGDSRTIVTADSGMQDYLLDIHWRDWNYERTRLSEIRARIAQ